MTLESEPERASRGCWPDRVRGDIDAGRTGDKAGGFDPAAAPLGADDEAGGAPLDLEFIARVRDMELAAAPRPSTRANSSTPELAPDGCGVRTPYLWPIAAGVLAAAALAGAVLLLV